MRDGFPIWARPGDVVVRGGSAYVYEFSLFGGGMCWVWQGPACYLDERPGRAE